MIQAENISFRHILHDINLTIKTGEIIAILGPNGAGKSTLLKCLAGSLTPDYGRITLNHQPLARYNLHALAQKRSVLSQLNQVAFPFLVSEIVMMGRNPYSGTQETKQDTAIVQAALESVDAWHLKDRLFPTLSGGEQQRVQLARALAQIWHVDEAYLFLDEPTSALDLKHQHQTLSLIKTRAQTHTTTTCLIMHDLYLARDYADKVLLLQHGRLYAYGPTAEILNAKTIKAVFEVDVVL